MRSKGCTKRIRNVRKVECRKRLKELTGVVLLKDTLNAVTTFTFLKKVG